VKTIRVLATLALAAISACSRSEAEPASSLQTTNVVTGALRITVEATGTVEPIRKVEVKSKASGEIQSLAVDVGDQVQTGALLARIDPRDVRNSHDQAQADLEVAQARLEISQAQNKRSKELLDGGVITAQEFENSRLDLANAQAALIKAQTNKELAELRLGDVTIAAPLSGTIIQKSVEEGQVIQSASQNVSGGTTLFVMANLNEMQVRTLVDETDMGQIEPGMPVSVQVEAFSNRQFQGYVDKVEPQAVVQQSVTMFPVIIRLDNRDGTLRPGMNAEVEILIDEAADILLVPNNAIVLPQDVEPAALVLGLDPESIDMAALGGRGRGGRAGGGGAAGPEGAGGPAAAPSGAAAGPGAGGGQGRAAERANGAPAAGSGEGAERAGAAAPPDLAALRARVQSGEITQDSARVLMRAARAGGGGGQGLGGGQGAGRGAGTGGGLGAARGSGVLTEPAAARPRQLRRAVVFVVNDAGVPEPRPVQIGLNDYDHTQIVSGVEEGDQIALLGAAELQAQQQQYLDRVRQRGGMGGFGGPVIMGPGGGGGGGGRGGR
jgi:HlyD family secretion protein